MTYPVFVRPVKSSLCAIWGAFFSSVNVSRILVHDAASIL